MELTFTRIDVPKFLEVDSMPHAFVARKGNETWWVVDKPVRFNEPVSWAVARTEESVYVPAVPMLIREAPHDALGFAMALGAKVLAGMRPIKRLHLVLGVPVEEIPVDQRDDPAFALRFYVGLAVLLE